MKKTHVGYTYICLYLSRCSIATKRHYYHRNSYKRKHLTGISLLFRGSVHFHHGGKHYAGDRAENLTSIWEGSSKRKWATGHNLSAWNLKAHPNDTSSNNATPNTATPYKPIWGSFSFKPLEYRAITSKDKVMNLWKSNNRNRNYLEKRKGWKVYKFIYILKSKCKKIRMPTSAMRWTIIKIL